jgi:hypothetical protein
MKPQSFWFHYNKPASRKAGHPVITVHYGGACHMVRNVRIHTPLRGRIRKTQPYFVLFGRGFCGIKDGVFYA